MGGRRVGFGAAAAIQKTACRRNSFLLQAFISSFFPFFTKRYLAYSVEQNVSPSLCRSPAVSLLVFFYRALFY